ncbi:VanZ family protein [Halorussus ruber]|uniref:VanZ family protein n=1 Tax=Halorussus ruber TaxID=1126238 RepID=UPI0034A5003F
MPRVPIPLAPRWFRWTSVVAVAGVIVYFSVLQTVPTPSDSPGPIWDKKLHFTAYAGLAYALAYATVEWRPNSRKRIGSVLATTILFGLLTELVQGTLPLRYYSEVDILANVVGATLVVPWFLAEYRVRYCELRELGK